VAYLLALGGKVKPQLQPHPFKTEASISKIIKSATQIGSTRHPCAWWARVGRFVPCTGPSVQLIFLEGTQHTKINSLVLKFSYVFSSKIAGKKITNRNNAIVTAWSEPARTNNHLTNILFCSRNSSGGKPWKRERYERNHCLVHCNAIIHRRV